MLDILKSQNKKTCYPFGDFQEQEHDRILNNIVVASYRRSGTHVLIDCILNNFNAYRNDPLYINLDKAINSRSLLDKILSKKNYVIKTHFPIVYDNPLIDEENISLIEELFRSSIILSPERDHEAVIRSMSKFNPHISSEKIRTDLENYTNYWESFEVTKMQFKSLISNDKLVFENDIVKVLSNIIGIIPDKEIKMPRRKEQKIKVYLDKVFTRIMGCKYSFVNTTIGFSK